MFISTKAHNAIAILPFLFTVHFVKKMSQHVNLFFFPAQSFMDKMSFRELMNEFKKVLISCFLKASVPLYDHWKGFPQVPKSPDRSWFWRIFLVYPPDTTTLSGVHTSDPPNKKFGQLDQEK